MSAGAEERAEATTDEPRGAGSAGESRDPGVTSPAWQHISARITEASWFQALIIGVIVANATTIGAATYPIGARAMRVFGVLDTIFLAVYVVEIVLRLAAVGFSPRVFARRGWNVFDFLVVLVSLMPGISTSTTVLRLVRLLRVSRLIRVMPDVRVLLDGLRRAAGPAASLLALITLMVYLYGVLGWILFAGRTPPDMPQYFANIGESMITLVELLTLEGWNSTMHDLRQVHPLALLYVLSFLVVGTYIVVNLVVGVVINSLDDAYTSRDRARRASELATDGFSVEDKVDQITRIARELELEMAALRERAETGRLDDASRLPANPLDTDGIR